MRVAPLLPSHLPLVWLPVYVRVLVRGSRRLVPGAASAFYSTSFSACRLSCARLPSLCLFTSIWRLSDLAGLILAPFTPCPPLVFRIPLSRVFCGCPLPLFHFSLASDLRVVSLLWAPVYIRLSSPPSWDVPSSVCLPLLRGVFLDACFASHLPFPFSSFPARPLLRLRPGSLPVGVGSGPYHRLSPFIPPFLLPQPSLHPPSFTAALFFSSCPPFRTLSFFLSSLFVTSPLPSSSPFPTVRWLLLT